MKPLVFILSDFEKCSHVLQVIVKEHHTQKFVTITCRISNFLSTRLFINSLDNLQAIFDSYGNLGQRRSLFSSMGCACLFLNRGDYVSQGMVGNPNNAALIVVLTKWKIFPWESFSDNYLQMIRFCTSLMCVCVCERE